MTRHVRAAIAYVLAVLVLVAWWLSLTEWPHWGMESTILSVLAGIGLLITADRQGG